MKKIYFLILSGVVGFALGFVIRYQVEGNKFVLAEWKEPPVVVICPDSQVTPFRVNQAIEWWGIRNFEIDYYHYDEGGHICDDGLFTQGIIFIRGQGYITKDLYAVTTRLAIKGEMKSASILLPNDNKHLPRLLEHELGHALGLTHVEKPGHMMHPIHEYGGEKFWIPD
jgi:hypothetical protein